MWKKRVGQALFYLLLVVLVVWLTGGVLLYLRGNLDTSSLSDWQSLFLLRTRPIASLLLLLAMVSILARRRLLEWLGGFKSLSRITQATILLSATFYLSLIATALFFPWVTGYSFKSDWALLTVAVVPLLALFLLIIIERAASVRAKFAGIEVEFQQTITSPFTQTVVLEEGVVTKASSSDLRRIVEGIVARRDAPHVLVVRIDSGRQMHIDFIALREYVYELSKVAPLEYIVFLKENDEYLGFMTVEQFKAKYPRFGMEMLLEDLERDERTLLWWERSVRGPFPLRDVREVLESIRQELVLPLWDPQRDSRRITERDLVRLGATQLYLRNPTVLEAYRRMIENRVPGIPVIDERRRFLGLADKEKVVQEVIIQLLRRDSN